MASKAKTPSTKAPETDVVEATAVETNVVVEKAAAAVEPIISAIKDVEKQGTSKMTEATQKATEFFADIRTKAGVAAEKGKKLAADATEFQKANIEAVIASGKIAAKGAQDMGKTNLEYAKANFTEVQAAVKELTAVKTPTDFVKVQGELAKKGFDTAVSQASKNTEAFVKLAGEMFQPISNRIAVATDYFKKAA